MVGREADLLRDQSVTQALTPPFTRHRLLAHAEVFSDLALGPEFRERFDGTHCSHS